MLVSCKLRLARVQPSRVLDLDLGLGLERGEGVNKGEGSLFLVVVQCFSITSLLFLHSCLMLRISRCVRVIRNPSGEV